MKIKEITMVESLLIVLMIALLSVVCIETTKYFIRDKVRKDTRTYPIEKVIINPDKKSYSFLYNVNNEIIIFDNKKEAEYININYRIFNSLTENEKPYVKIIKGYQTYKYLFQDSLISCECDLYINQNTDISVYSSIEKEK